MKIHTPTFQRNFSTGLAITATVALASMFLAKVPYLEVIGALVVAIILGMVIASTFKIPSEYDTGIEFSSKKLLRIGIVLLGLRLNLHDIYSSGLGTFIYATVLMVVAFATVYATSRFLRVDRTLGLLVACGTAICGAAAIAAVAPLIQAKDKAVAISIATIALLGTSFTIVYTILFPMLTLTSFEYGAFTGGTLHEIAHVVAASSIGGQEAEDMALIVKLSRVMLLVPMAILIGMMYERKIKRERKHRVTKLPFPWFVVGFLFMSVVQTTGVLPDTFITVCIEISYFLLAMAMAGLGLKTSITSFKVAGARLICAGLIGSLVLAGTGYMLILISF